MNKSLHTTTIRILLTGVFLLCLTFAWAQSQTFQNGIRKGLIKVKFSPSAAAMVSQMPANARGSKFTTGIQSVDAVATKVKATGMQRLFPYDARFENKLHKHGLHLWYTVEIDENIDPKTAVAQFNQLKEVTVAEVEREKTLAPYAVKPYTPGISASAALPFNDPFLKDQWHYDNTGQNGFSDADINVFEAWTKTSGANNIIVSVHDEGVDVNHNDLKANIWVNQAELNGTVNIDDDNNGYVDDINGYNFEKGKGAVDAQYHGSHVAGTIAAVNNNGIGVSGVAGGNGSGNGVRIMSLQIFGNALVEKSYVYAANNGAVISQNSWGYTATGFYEQAVLDAIDYFVAEAGDYEGSPMKGGIVIFAAGNKNSDHDWYPQYHPNTFAVASIGPEWKKASYSNFGEWVEVSAPGGDSEFYGSKGGILSTIPNNQYAYLNGTSMACPHVSGIAALALANRTHQLTNTELWNKLSTGVVSIEEQNPNHAGKLGTGAIDAFLAIQNDQGFAPATITNLTVTGTAQEFATFTWTVPSDADDARPVSFDLYYHTQAITSGNLGSSGKVTIKNTLAAGSQFSYELSNLLGLTTYYFAITATDRWGNVSVLSPNVLAKTNDGPEIAVDENSVAIELSADASTSTLATHNITILNNASGVLRWDHFMRHTNTSLSFNAAALHYPTVTKTQTDDSNVGMRAIARMDEESKLRSNEPETAAFTYVEKNYTYFADFIIGEDDPELTNSAAAKFYVTEAGGFNLTQVQMYLNHDPELGPVIMEVYKGTSLAKENLVYAQEYSHYSAGESWAYIQLNEQLYFESGSMFWIAFHVPKGNDQFTFGIGPEVDPSYSANCFLSFNMGSKWMPLEDIARNYLALSISANSYNEHLGTYLTLNPGSGDINGNEQTLTTLTANATTLINGNYSANLVLASNDAENQELRIPVSLTVSGHQPKIKHVEVAEFGGIFIGESKTLELVLENTGFGKFTNLQFTTVGTRFKVVDGYAPYEIPARSEGSVLIKFTPTAAGNNSSVLTVTDGSQTYKISLFGLGVRPSKIAITPVSQVVNNITIGDVVNAQITVKNTGLYPLKYFIPGYDAQGISDNWPSDYHTYGYKLRTNYASEANPIPYEFENISTTGIDISSQLIDDGVYATVDMGFSFPYYGESMNTIYIAQKGFTTFDNSVNPVNTPYLGGSRPGGYISPLGDHLKYFLQGKIFYQLEADRMIIQYDNVTDGSGSATVQMVLYATGDIRFFYDEISIDGYNVNILIEDVAKQDGILVHDNSKQIDLHAGLALGFDYPGPNIITHVENGSGVIAPNASSVVDIEMSTSSLTEGTVNRYINFISNDPLSPQTSALVQLEITNGGTPEPQVSTDAIAFGNVFKGAIKSTKFTIKNLGSADVDITSITMRDAEFIVSGDLTTSIKPGLYKVYDVAIPTNALATLDDMLSINYADGSKDQIHVTGKVVKAPAITVDLTPIQETLAYGTTSLHQFTIKNTGLAPLDVTTTGKHWLSFETAAAPIENSYTYEKYNTGEYYQWIDIRETGTQMPFTDDEYSLESYWRELTLPFPIEFYGQTYTEIKIGDNGVISFEENPEMLFASDEIPSQAYPGKYIMPYWTFGGFNTIFFPKEDVGIFYQLYDDKIIVTWSYLRNNFGGMGDPISAQWIMYKNGTMKFQYRVEEAGSDETSLITLIGLQESSDNGISISHNQSLDHGNGLVYVIVPAKKHVLAPNATLSGKIKLDATNIYAGQYNTTLKINSNAPNNELLEKPIELTVTGDPVIAVADEVDFGSKMVALEPWGEAKATYIELPISNTGAGAFDITWAQMADGTQSLSLQVWALMPNFFGELEWRWADVSEIWGWESPVFTVNAGTRLKARASFAPAVAGDFTDELVLTTSLGETRVVLKGISFEPPVIKVTTDSINEVMNALTEKVTRSIAFNNAEGLSDLNYQVSIDFGRATTARTNSEAMNTNGFQSQILRSTNANGPGNGARTQAVYNRVLKHTQKESPNTFVGIGAAGTFRVATKFNAGPQGFNLSHVETWFRREILTSGTILVEIRAGSTSIADAATLAEGTFQISGTGADNIGAWHAIKLDKPAGIYPNEDFYVIITYPLGVELPQGTINNEPTTLGRYHYFDFGAGKWNDIQEIPTFEKLGWLMYAAEETAGSSAWLTVTSPLSGAVTAGNESSVNLLIDGTFSQRGDQIANVILTSNDPKKDTVRIPVKLHMNEAPQFNKVPVSIFAEEGKTITVNLTVTDKEAHSFTVAKTQGHPWLSHTFTNGTLTLTLAPDFGDAGNYTIAFTATDQHNAVRELTIPVEVAHTNRAPEFIGENESMNFSATGTLNAFEIEDFFSDPDGDDFTFNLANSNSSSVVVFASESEFLIRPMAVGEAKLAFTVTDTHGAITRDTIVVKVDIVLGSEEDMVNNGLGVYPNPATDQATITVTNDWAGDVFIIVLDVNGKQYLTQKLDTVNAREIQVDVSSLTKGIYILRAVSKTKQATLKLIKK